MMKANNVCKCSNNKFSLGLVRLSQSRLLRSNSFCESDSITCVSIYHIRYG